MLQRRHGGDPSKLQEALAFLQPIRDRILAEGKYRDGRTLVDVGCGDGLIAFGALQMSRSGEVWFTDVSERLSTVGSWQKRLH